MSSILGDVPLTTGIRRLFYALTPNESTFETPEEVPRYTDQVKYDKNKIHNSIDIIIIDIIIAICEVLLCGEVVTSYLVSSCR